MAKNKKQNKGKKEKRRKIKKAKQRKIEPTSKKFIFFFLTGIMFFYYLFSTDFFREHLFEPINHGFAVVASFFLNILGQETYVQGLKLASVDFSVNIAKGCDSLEAIALLAIAFAVFPMSYKLKLKGILIGTSLFLLLNLFRILSLFLIGRYVPSIFDFMHVDVWQVIFLVAIISFWLYWVLRSMQHKNIVVTS